MTEPTSPTALDLRQIQLAAEAARRGRPVPPVGIHYDVPDAEYRAWDAMNHSSLEIAQAWTWWHFRRDREAAVTAKPEHFVLGSLVDCLLFTPDRFADLFIVAEEAPDAPINPTTKQLYGRDTKKFEAWFAAQPPGREIVDLADMRIARALIASIEQSSCHALLTDEDAKPQVSLVWDSWGVRCKARLDVLRADDLWILDFKTTEDARPAHFARQAANYGYDRQAAFYIEGAWELGLKVDKFSHVVVEKNAKQDKAANPKYAVVRYDMSIPWIEKAIGQNAKALQEYQSNLRTGVWLGYEGGILEPPKWLKLEE